MREVEGEEQRKQHRKRHPETNEECIEEMFSQVGMEQDDDGYHVVQEKCSVFSAMGVYCMSAILKIAVQISEILSKHVSFWAWLRQYPFSPL